MNLMNLVLALVITITVMLTNTLVTSMIYTLLGATNPMVKVIIIFVLCIVEIFILLDKINKD